MSDQPTDPGSKSTEEPKPEEKAKPALPAAPTAKLDNNGTPKTQFQEVRPSRPPGAEAALGGAPLSQPVATARPAKPVPRLGNPTFDPPSAEVLATRAIIEEVKHGCGVVIDTIRRYSNQLSPKLEELAKNSKELKAREDFDPAEAQKFLKDCEGAIDKLSK